METAPRAASTLLKPPVFAAALFWGTVALAQPPATPPPYFPTAAPPMAPGPYLLQSADGKSRLKIGGLIQSDFRLFTGSGRTSNNAFTLRRVRPILDGALNNLIEFRLMPEFGEGRAALQDAYVDLRLRPALRLRSGKYKVPYSLERLQAAAEVPFIERSLANNLVPVRDVGVMLLKEPTRDGDFEWELGVFNGGADSTSLDGNGDSSLEVMGRLFWQPRRGQGLGIAATSGSATELLTGVGFRTAGRTSFFRYADGVSGDGSRTRIAPQFFWYTGSWGFLGEHFTTRQRLRNATSTVRQSDTNQGLNLQASYVLTGEKTSFRNVVPRTAYDTATGRGGAWELVARFSTVRTDPGTVALGLVDPSISAQNVQAWTIGTNWYLNRQTKLQFNVERTDFGRPIRFSTGSRRVEEVFLSRVQLLF